MNRPDAQLDYPRLAEVPPARDFVDKQVWRVGTQLTARSLDGDGVRIVGVLLGRPQFDDGPQQFVALSAQLKAVVWTLTGDRKHRLTSTELGAPGTTHHLGIYPNFTTAAEFVVSPSFAESLLRSGSLGGHLRTHGESTRYSEVLSRSQLREHVRYGIDWGARQLGCDPQPYRLSDGPQHWLPPEHVDIGLRETAFGRVPARRVVNDRRATAAARPQQR